MLQELYQLDTYFEGPEKAVFEADLNRQYGEKNVLKAISEGWIEHRRMKFRDGRERCICWISDSGRAVVEKQQACGTLSQMG